MTITQVLNPNVRCRHCKLTRRDGAVIGFRQKLCRPCANQYSRDRRAAQQPGRTAYKLQKAAK